MRDRPQVRFVLIMAVFGVAVWMVFRDSVMGPVIVPLRAITAEATLLLVRATDLDGLRSASVIIHSSGFAMEITRGCTGFAGAAVLVAGIIAYHPAVSRQRFMGLLVCLPAFVGINLVRMTHLYHLGVAKSQFFHLAHTVIWQVGMMITVFCLWFAWVRWTESGPYRHARPSGVTTSLVTS